MAEGKRIGMELNAYNSSSAKRASVGYRYTTLTLGRISLNQRVLHRFLVDDGSDLYYDPTPILEAVKKLTEDEAPKPHESHKPVGRGTPQPMRGDPGGREFAPQHPHGMPHDGGVVGTPQHQRHQRHPGVQAYPPYGVGVGMSPAGANHSSSSTLLARLPAVLGPSTLFRRASSTTRRPCVAWAWAWVGAWVL
ncbi:hypothetical protein PTI98_010517 [Pleurotus ostreatus]|nr:hypothetical protein PTI98_010517 [Pleurotus ostreatus]